MRVSGVQGGSGYQSAELAEVKRGVAVLKKQQDVAKDQGEAMVDLVKASSTSDVGGRIDVYA